jgi:succinoglycan biosynthesis protein ExoW
VKIAVVIPFYQRDPGVLSRALASVYAQDLAEGAELDVIIVNDDSPLDPAGDIASAGAAPNGISVRVIHRANGGPGASRNTGFEAATDADAIALIDSDDIWAKHHIGDAMTALEAGADAYFSDHLAADGLPYLARTDFLASIKNSRAPTLAAPDGMIAMAGADIADYSTREYLAHTSSIVYRNRFPGLRMSELLRSAGEDHLFFIDLALAAGTICFSLERDVELGEGVNIYARSTSWGDEADLRRRAYNLASLKLQRDRADWKPSTRADMNRRVREGRNVVGYLLLRRIATKRKIDPALLNLVWRLDRGAVMLAPFSPLWMAFSSRRQKGEAFRQADAASDQAA